MQTLRLAALTLALLPGALTHLHAGVVTFDFDSDITGNFTPFTDTVSGLSATFTSSGDPGGFEVGPTFFQSLTGQVLLDPGPAALNDLTLSILFSAPQVSISMNFATNSAPGVLLTLNAFNGATPVGSASASGTIPSGLLFPEGVLSFGGATFDRVVLSAPAPDFAIDNLTVSDVPEPGGIFLCVGALGGLLLMRKTNVLVRIFS